MDLDEVEVRPKRCMVDSRGNSEDVASLGERREDRPLRNMRRGIAVASPPCH